jgi:nicotinamidase-related amidase
MKHPYTLSRTKTGLLIIDVQEKFGPAIPDFQTLVMNATKLVLTFQMFKMPILVTEQYPKGLGRTVEKVRRQFPLLEVIEKVEFSCTQVPQFWDTLHPLNLEALVVCGVETHVCINQTTLGLLQRGYRVHVVADAVGSRTRFDHDIALRKMEKAGAILSTTEICLFELAEKAGTESFKNIQRMVKAAANAGGAPVRPAPVADPPKTIAAPASKPASIAPAKPSPASMPAARMTEKAGRAEKQTAPLSSIFKRGESAAKKPTPVSVSDDTAELKLDKTALAETKKSVAEADDGDDPNDTKLFRLAQKASAGESGENPAKDDEIDIDEIKALLDEEVKNDDADEIIV